MPIATKHDWKSKKVSTVYLNDIQVSARYGLHRTWAWRALKNDPSFPKPTKLTAGTTRWKLADIEAWEQKKQSAK